MKIVKKICCFILTAVLLSSNLTIPVYAEEASLFSEAEISLESEAAPVLSVTYPKDIKCNTPVDFTLNLSGQSGSYQYMLYRFDIVYNDGSSEMLLDISRNNPYQDSNVYTYTFYASGTYRIRFSALNTTTYQAVRSQIYEFTVSDPDYPSVEEKADAIAAECNRNCSTDYEKAVWLHDWILDHITYDNTMTYCSAEGALARGTGTCESYHRAYVMLLNRVGIPTGRVTGNGHVWTAVKLDGEWYQVDATWNDTNSNRHLYFGLNDYLIGLAHLDHAATSAGAGYQYPSTSLEKNYLIQSGEITKWSALFEQSISDKLNAGETMFSIPIPEAEYQNYETEIIYHLVAYYLSKQQWNGRTISASYNSIKEENSSGGSVSYRDRKITVQVRAAESLRVTPPTKTDYIFGDTVDTSGLTVTLMYTDGSSDILQEGEYQVSGFSTDAVGNRTASVSYGALSASFDYSVADALESLSITAPPSKTVYRKGESVSTSGMIVTAVYKSGVRKILDSSQYVVSGFNTDTAGTRNAAVSYGGKSTSFSYTVQIVDDAPAEQYPIGDGSIKGFVTRLYERCLNRSGDQEGMAYWQSMLEHNHKTGAEVAYGFVFSQEMENKNLSNEEFVELLYEVMMGRASDAVGKADWLYRMENGLGREGVFKGFADSAEFSQLCNSYGIIRGTIEPNEPRNKNSGLTAFVARLYTKALGRKYETEGLNDWCGRVLNGSWSIDDVATTGFFNSREFLNRNLSDEEYVKVLYRTFFDREYEQEGYDYWMAKLAGGMNRNEVLKGFAHSQEFANLKKSFGL